MMMYLMYSVDEEEVNVKYALLFTVMKYKFTSVWFPERLQVVGDRKCLLQV